MSPIQKSLAFVATTGIAFAICGGVIGALIGTFAPDYYRVVLASGSDPDFNPLQLGVGLGVTQGLVVGVVIAIALVIASAMGRGRETGVENQHTSAKAVSVVVGIIVLSLCVAGVFLLGLISGPRANRNPTGQAEVDRTDVDQRLLGMWERSEVWGEDFHGDAELDHMFWLIRGDGTCWLMTCTLSENSKGKNPQAYDSNLLIDEQRKIMTTQGFDLRYTLTEVPRAYILKVEFTGKDLQQIFFRRK